MRHRFGLRTCAALAGALALSCFGSAARAAEPYEIHVIATITGPSSFVGLYMQQNLAAFEAAANAKGGVAGRPLKFVFDDDQSQPQVAVQLATQVIAAHPAALLVTGPVANCAAVAPLLTSGPVMWCLSPALHPAAGSYAFSAGPSSYDGLAAVLRYFRMKGWTRIAVLNTTDATGQDADRGIDLDLALPENAAMRKVSAEHFTPSDLTVAAQIERIKNSEAQALIAWVTGSPLATVLKGMIQAGLDIPIVPSGGNQVFAQLAQYAGFLPKQLLIPSAAFPPHDGILTLDPRVEQVQHEMYAILAAHGLKADNNTADSWDAALITLAGLNKLGPDATAAQLRNYILDLTDFPGIDGLYDFPKAPERGLSGDLSIVTRYDPQGPSWQWLTKLGGAPLAP